MRLLSALPLLLILAPTTLGADVPLADGGQAKVVICVPPRIMDDAKKNPEELGDRGSMAPAATQRRLRESVRDLAEVLGRITGAKFDISTSKPAPGDKRLPLLIAEFASEKFGAPKKAHPYKQGCSIVVTKDAIGL